VERGGAKGSGRVFVTYCYFRGNKIDFVQHKDQMFVRRFSPNVLLHTATPSPIGIAGVQHVQNDIARIDDLVQLVPDALTRALHEDELSCLRKVAVGIEIVGLGIARVSREQMRLLQAVEVRVVHGASPASKIFNGAEVELWTLALRLGTKRVAEWLRLDSDLSSMLLQAVDVALLLDQAHGQLVALHEIRCRVGGLCLHSRAERLERVLRNDTRVVEPLPVRLDTGNGRLPRLVGGGLGDVSLSVALGLAVSQALENLDLLCRAGGELVFACRSLRKTTYR
jgi:hypothetical protein